ncbi:MAG: protein-L-isoaspartate(D-aspartate) O-methyltransferase [Chlamydiota bacterium]|nr:protein-L-isoaspartate(D-aspartate) O-methyltransferase [Chlamydiota bacterium]
MVENQIVSRGVTHPDVLKAMRQVPRHQFVPQPLENLAYTDQPLPIGEGQTISQPYIVALMSETIRPEKTDRILEIGTGSGYQAAVLAEVVQNVYSIEIIPALAKEAQDRLHELGYQNVYTKCADGYLGWPEYAPFDAIVVTAAPPKIPQPLVEQLSEGGRMIIPVADSYPQRLLLVEKKNGQIQEKEILPVMFVPMTGEAQEK